MGEAATIRLYAGCWAAVCVAAATACLLLESAVPSLPVVAALACAAAVAERGTVRLNSRTQVSISLVPTLFAAVLFGPAAALLVGVLSMAGELARPDWRSFAHSGARLVVYTSSRGFIGCAAGAVAGLAGGASADLQAVVAGTAAAASTAAVLDVAVAALTLLVRTRARVGDFLRGYAPAATLSVVLYTPVVALLSFSYQELSEWTLPLFLVPALAAQRLYALYQEQRRLAGDLAAVNERLEKANLSFASALVATLDARDRYTAGHSAAVAMYARDIAARMGLPEDVQAQVHLAGLVHDIGKIGLPPGLLEKDGALTLAERRQMQEHAAIGERILKNVASYADVAEIVRHHHERVDGNGYPDGLCGDQIPLLSRIIAVADAYDAMTSDRPYREAMANRVARLRLAQAVESQFDTTVVAAFEAILAGAPTDYAARARVEYGRIVDDAHLCEHRLTA